MSFQAGMSLSITVDSSSDDGSVITNPTLNAEPSDDDVVSC